jgi:hypothetical protein
MSQTNTSRKDSKATATREKGMKQFSPNRLFHRVKMPKITKIFIEFRPAEIGVERPAGGAGFLCCRPGPAGASGWALNKQMCHSLPVDV